MDKRRVSRPRRTRADGAAVEPAPETVQTAASPAEASGVAGTVQPADDTGSVPNAEIELKLSIGPDDARRLGRLPSIRQSLRGRARRHTLHSVYYDTPGFELRRDGVALRLRRDGTRWEVTAKWPGSVEGALHARPELTVPLRGEPVLPFVLPAGPLRARLRVVVLERPLVPVLITDVARQPLDLLAARGARVLAEMALDVVQLRHPDGTAAAPLYGEVEIERRRGDTDDCLAAARQLRQQFDLIPSPATKYGRGLAAVLGEAAPGHSGRRTLDGREPLGVAVRTLVATQLERLRAAEPEARDERHPEPLHEMRVALRRTRTALRAFPEALPARQREALLRELAWLGEVLGGVRDLDVQLARAAELRAGAAPAARAALDGYRHHLQRERRRRRAELVAVLDGRRVRSLLLALERVAAGAPPRGLPARAAEPFAVAGRRAAKRAMRRLRRRGKSAGALTDAAGLHALRIRAKRLRYVLEALRPLGGAPCRRLITQVIALQDALGQFNDAMVAAAALRDYNTSLGRGAGTTSAVGGLADAELRRAGVAQADFQRAWKRFTSKATRRRRRKLLARLTPDAPPAAPPDPLSQRGDAMAQPRRR